MAVRHAWYLMLLVSLTTACGKKGPPLAPLHLVPAAVTDVTARRVEDGVRLRFVLPAKNVNGPGIDLDRVEIYAVTVVPGAQTPPNRELLTRAHLVGQIQVKPPPVDGAEPAPDDKRPAPGDTATFVEPLPATALDSASRPAVVSAAPAPADPARPAGDPQPGAPAPDTVTVTQPVRIYVLRGVARNGHSGPSSARLQVPLGAGPSPPGGVLARHTEKAVVVEWLPAVATVGGTALAYNVYRADALQDPLNASPLASPPYEHAAAALGVELCFRVRSVVAGRAVSVESPPSEPACVTPADVFPPAPPKGLATVTTPGAVQLIWDANTEPDLAGYLVLRAEAPDETLQPLTPAPIRDTVYRDTSVKPGVSYKYAIVAVDSATPPNRSEPSALVDAIAR